jgi:hypothetical protein
MNGNFAMCAITRCIFPTSLELQDDLLNLVKLWAFPLMVAYLLKVDKFFIFRVLA